MIDIIDSCDSKVLCFRTHCLGQNAEGTTYVLVHILHRRTGWGVGGVEDVTIKIVIIFEHQENGRCRQI